MQSTFTSHPRHRARAAKNLENYLVKKVTNMLYQVRLEAVKKWCHRNNEDCDDRVVQRGSLGLACQILDF
jgi:hypothetical protein